MSGGDDREEGGADYGVDAPLAVRNAVLVGSACGLQTPLAYALIRRWGAKEIKSKEGRDVEGRRLPARAPVSRKATQTG